MLESVVDFLFVRLQYLIPAHRVGQFVRRLTRSRRPWLKDLLIGMFVRRYRVDVAEAEFPVPDGYEHVNAFFTRGLKLGARPVDQRPGAVVSPADGTVEEIGQARGEHLIQAKRFRYRLADLLAVSDAEAAPFNDGSVLTIYLAPHNYHRVHLPLGARITAMTYVPGRRLAVNQRTARTVDGLFARNERVVCWCQAPGGRFAVVLVGAFNVASISTAWSGEVPSGDAVRHTQFDATDPRLDLATGAVLGQFNLGSTVVVVAEAGLMQWSPGIAVGQEVRVGQLLGQGRVSDT
jgi:phosphatidylserine decarboxylase